MGTAGNRGRRLSPPARKWVLLLHVVTSVGWIGVEACLLTLGVLGQTGADPELVRSAYVTAGLLGSVFYLPLSLLAVVSGLALSLGTKWGLLRYPWIVVKLVISLALLIGGNLSVVPKFAAIGEAAARGQLPGTEALIFVNAMAAGITLLLVATVLSVFKPGRRLTWRLATAPVAAARSGSPRSR
ncbi:hypothetical protein [Amycolatopsis suaedae]|uniref:hypothetical protein n=1 Tax=Amycolatopsis suaedae TaxID=2510978 RepID=UPI00196A82CF|nr:hypothetical protein [Amycolatopsis suaedae]